MGNIISNTRNTGGAYWWNSSSNGHVPAVDDAAEESAEDEDDKEPSHRVLSPEKAREVEEFKKQLAEKREARKCIIDEKRREMQTLKEQLVNEKRLREEALAENNALRKVIAENNLALPTNDEQRSDDDVISKFEEEINQLKDQCRSLKIELGNTNYALQSANSELALRCKENSELDKHIVSLKEVNKVTKTMLSLKDQQVTQLKEKLVEIEKSLEDRETKTLSTNLKNEYERQLENIRNLRLLYEERARMAEITKQNLLRDLENQKGLTDSNLKKCEELEVRVGELEKELSDKSDVLGSTESQLGLSKAETRSLQAEMNVINKLFSQILLGYKNPHDLDKLLSKLEENHNLLIDMVYREDCNEISSALPKLILELANQVDTSNDPEKENPEKENDEEACSSNSVNSPQEIVGNLPKVWRVLMELLSHQSGPVMDDETLSDKKSCYKSVETPTGPQLVPSVSKTYIRLKDLILEKNSLQKEMMRLKQLNSHLENRLQDQERRLSLVSSELNKTWHVVGRMQRQHQQLHTHEKILQYELQQKRVLLTQLKEELEFCKEKWDMAKQKNSESQIEWDKLRQEFASRKIGSNDSVNNSAESGYSDERPSDDESVASIENQKIERKRYKKKSKSPDRSILELKQANEKSEDNNDSFAIQEDDIGTKDLTVDDNLDSLSDVEEQGNLGDIEDQSEAVDCTPVLESIPVEPDNEPSSSANSATCYDDVLAARSTRLKKLEEQCYVLVHKVNKTKDKSVLLCNRLEELHNQYGSSSDLEQPSTSSQNMQHNIDSSKETEAECSREQNDRVGISTEECVAPPPPLPPPLPKKSYVEEYEARFAARDERLKRMEEQAKTLVNKVTNTSTRSVAICTKLEELHSTYGKSEDTENSNENTDNNKAGVLLESSNSEVLLESSNSEVLSEPSNSEVLPEPSNSEESPEFSNSEILQESSNTHQLSESLNLDSNDNTELPSTNIQNDNEK